MRVSRRRFGIGAVATLTGAGGAEAGGGPQAEFSDLPPEQAAEVEARLGEAVRRYGDRLSETQRQRLHRVLTQNVRMLSAMRSFPLENRDASATSLKLAVEKVPDNETCPKKADHAR